MLYYERTINKTLMENNGYEIKPSDDLADDMLNDILLVGTDLVGDKLKGTDRGDAYRKFADLADTYLKCAHPANDNELK